MPQRRLNRPAKASPELIRDPETIQTIANRLSSEALIAFDTEFLRERTFYPQLGLLQIADKEDAWLIDPLEVSVDDMRPLLDVLTSPSVLKAAHSAEQDQECLYSHYGVVAAPLFDTSIGAALTGKGDQIGLAPLLRKVMGVNLPKGHTRTNWLNRPLTPAMCEYAVADVAHLVELADKLLNELKRRGRRNWALKLSAQMADPAKYEADGTAIAYKLAVNARLSKREYAVLKELAQWRESRVRKRNIPRRWLAEDQILVQLARAQPKQAEELASFRGLGARVRDYGAAHILEAIERGLAAPEDELEAPPEKPEPVGAESSAVAVLKCFLNFLAQESDVPLRYLLDSDAPLLLLRGDFETVEELEQSGILGAGALETFGEEILALLSGRRALKIEDGQAVRFDPDGTGGPATPAGRAKQSRGPRRRSRG
ncbi:MAG: ribonuclease D [Bryobacterales bacterium]|nr:ribonuclease D [Bryobacterales bacterium]